MHLLFAFVDVMTHERCKASQYVGAGLGGCARSVVVVSVHGGGRAAFERVVERALCGRRKWFIFYF